MVKTPLMLTMVVSIALINRVYGEDITNISQCINTNLTSEVLDSFPTNATSTIQNCVN